MGEVNKPPHVYTVDELADIAFSRAKKDQSKFKKIRNKDKMIYLKEKDRIKKAASTLRSRLEKIIRGMPSVNTLPQFYQDLLATLVDLDKFRKSLGALQWCVNSMKTIESECMRKLRANPAQARREAYGRFMSVLKKIKSDLEYLGKASLALRKMPTIKEDMKTLVIAGYPNVGKSTLLRALTGSDPEIAPYPFTTKGLKVGHFEERWYTYQVIDTPGLLDRPLSHRSDIERQAIAALRNIADLVIFIFDLSENTYYPFDVQEALYNELRELFPGDIIVVFNKADASDHDLVEQHKKEFEGAFAISAEKNEGTEELRKLCADKLSARM